MTIRSYTFEEWLKANGLKLESEECPECQGMSRDSFFVTCLYCGDQGMVESDPQDYRGQYRKQKEADLKLLAKVMTHAD